MTHENIAEAPIAITTHRWLYDLLPAPRMMGAVLGPIIGLAIWWLPLGVEPTAHKALAIVAFMLVYWILEPIDYGITALMGCYLFWVLHVTKFSVAFSGFATTSPWFILGVVLLGGKGSRGH